MSVGLFVDIEPVAVAWLSEQLPDVRVVTKLPGPADVEGHELIRVTRSPGSNDARSARPRTDIECFAPDRTRMWVLAGRANNALAELSGHVVAGHQVDDVSTVTDPVPGWWSPTVERSVAVYEWNIRA